MSFEKMKLTIEQVQAFETENSDQPITDLVPLSGGEWSQAFGFKQAGRDLVVRFGKHQEDYLIDQTMAASYGSEKLPIPKVLEIGKAFNGYYAVSERAFGPMIDSLDKAAMRRVIPSLFTTMDAIRQTDISDKTGYGPIDAAGQGKYASWYDFLLDVDTDTPDKRTYGWRKGLTASPVGIKPFEQGYAALKELARNLPYARSLVHNDLINFNVLVNDDQITAVIDWANALYGDFLYDLAMFTFWGPIHEPVKDIDWQAEALNYYQSIGLEVSEFDRRLRCCMIHLGLDAMSYYGFKRNWEWLEPVAKRTLEIAN